MHRLWSRHLQQKTHLWLIVGLLPLWVGSVVAQSPWLTLEGQALAPNTGEVLYRERHSLAQDAGQRWVMESDYLEPEGGLMAERTVWFSAEHPQSPDYRLIDYRDEFEEGARRLDDGRVELFRVIDGTRETAIITPSTSTPLVIDAGFSAFIEQNWEALLAGKRMRFDFASSARLTTIEFRLSHIESIETDEANTLERFRLEPSNWFVRMLVEPIILTYATNNKTLVGYSGLSNIRKEGGGNYIVEIQFPPNHQFTMRQLPSGLRQAVP